MRTKTRQATPDHEAFRLELLAAMRPVVDHCSLPVQDMLAVTANLCGGLIAALDQTKFTPAMAMEIVVENVTLGNERAIEEIRGGPAAGSA